MHQTRTTTRPTLSTGATGATGVTWFALTLLGALTLVPIASVLWGSVRSGPPGTASSLTFDNYRRLVADPHFTAALGNTVTFTLWATVLSVAAGTYLAWLTERSDIPFRRGIYVVAIAPIFVPGLLTTVAWSLFLNSRVGFGNSLIAFVFPQARPLFDAHSMPAMILAEVSDSFTLAFILMVATLRAMDGTLEDASATSGAGPFRTATRITLPVVAPGLATSAVLVFINTIDSFHVPAILGLPGNIHVLATEIYLTAYRFPSDLNLASTYSTLYLIVAVLALAAYWRVTHDRSRFATVSGTMKASRAERGRLSWMQTVSAYTFLGITVAIPLVVLVYASLLPFYRPPTAVSLDDFSLRSYRRVMFDTPTTVRALRNNFAAGTGAALATMAIGTTAAWVASRSRTTLRRTIDLLATAPIAFPGLVIAVALIWFYLHVPLPIYATLWILVIAYTTAFVPYSYRAADAAITQVDRDLEDASTVAGATDFQTLRRVMLPLVFPAIAIAGLFVLSRTFRVLSLPILLSGPGSDVLPVVMFGLQERAGFAEVSALGVLIVIGTVATFGAARLITTVTRSRWT